MPKFYVGVVATARVEIEADTQEEAEVLAIASACLLNSPSTEWSIEYCDELDEDEDDDDEDDDDEDDDEDDDDEDDDDFKFANEA